VNTADNKDNGEDNSDDIADTGGKIIDPSNDKTKLK
jgi:hypothetical protein